MGHAKTSRCLVVGLLFAIFSLSAARAADKSRIVWHSDLTKASRLTKEQQRPLLMFITMNGCHYCDKMKSRTYADTNIVRAMSSGFVPLRVDGPKNPKLVRRLGVKIYPTTVILSPERQVLSQIDGYVGPHRLRAKMQAVSKSYRVAKKEAETGAEDGT